MTLKAYGMVAMLGLPKNRAIVGERQIQAELLEDDNVLMCFDHVASIIIDANHGIM